MQINKIIHLVSLVLIIGFMFCNKVAVLAQNADSAAVNALLDENFLPPLNILIEEAKKHSPLLEKYNTEIAIKERETKSIKRNWSKYINLGGSVQYGTYDSYVSNSVSDGQLPLGSISTGQQSRYSLGLFINLPLSSVYNRNNEINIGRLETEKIKKEKERVVNELVQKLTVQYADLLLARKILILRNDNLNSVNVQMAMSEQKFKSGKMKVSELVLIQNVQTKAKIDLEKAKTNYYKSMSLLEQTCGIKLNLNR